MNKVLMKALLVLLLSSGAARSSSLPTISLYGLKVGMNEAEARRLAASLGWNLQAKEGNLLRFSAGWIPPTHDLGELLEITLDSDGNLAKVRMRQVSLKLTVKGIPVFGKSASSKLVSLLGPPDQSGASSDKATDIISYHKYGLAVSAMAATGQLYEVTLDKPE